MAFTAGYQAVYLAMLLLLFGIPIYSLLKARRERRGDVADPVELTEDDTDAVAVLTPGPVQRSH